MSVARSLPPVEPFFMQACPFCSTLQRMMIKGNYVKDNKWERYPDMGYSFCNCRNVFFTKWENITEPMGWNGLKYPLDELTWKFNHMQDDEVVIISMLDPYFINWNAPHEMWHWQARKVYILWDMDSFADECRRVGFEVVSATRDMDVESKTPQNFHVTVRKPCQK